VFHRDYDIFPLVWLYCFWFSAVRSDLTATARQFPNRHCSLPNITIKPSNRVQ